MKSLFKYVILTAFILSFINSCKENPAAAGNNLQLNGKWSETFSWINEGNGIYSSGVSSETNMQKTSTLTLSGDSFILKILPPNIVSYINNGTVYSGFNKDTLYTGKYSVRHDTLLFILDEDGSPHYFTYNISNYSLNIAQLPIKKSGSLYIVSSSEFLWGNSFNKHAGRFARLD